MVELRSVSRVFVRSFLIDSQPHVFKDGACKRTVAIARAVVAAQVEIFPLFVRTLRLATAFPHRHPFRPIGWILRLDGDRPPDDWMDVWFDVANPSTSRWPMHPSVLTSIDVRVLYVKHISSPAWVSVDLSVGGRNPWTVLRSGRGLSTDRRSFPLHALVLDPSLSVKFSVV